MSLQQVLPLWKQIIGLYFSVVFRFSEVHRDLPSGQLMEHLDTVEREQLRLPKAFAEDFNRRFGEVTKRILQVCEDEPDFSTILASSFVVRALECLACWACGCWGLLVGPLQFVVAPLSFTGSFIRFLTNVSDCLLHYACSFVVALAFVLTGHNRGPMMTIDTRFVVGFLSIDFLLNCLVYVVTSERFGAQRLLLHAAYGTFNTKTYFFVVLGSLFGYRFDLRVVILTGLLTLAVKSYGLHKTILKGCGWPCFPVCFYVEHRIGHLPVVYQHAHKMHHYLHDTTAFDAHIYGSGMNEAVKSYGLHKTILKGCGWPCFPVCFYVEHRIGHLPVVYQHAHKMHHYLHDTTAFDAHIYGSGMNEEFFWIWAEVLPCLLCPSLFFPYFLNFDTLYMSLTNKPAHTRTCEGSCWSMAEDNFHADHHTLHRANYGSALGVLLDFYFGTQGSQTKGAGGLAYQRSEEGDQIVLQVQRAQGPLSVPQNQPPKMEEDLHVIRDAKLVVTEEQLAAHHSDETGVWIALKGGVYDVSAFHRIHPGGSQIILDHAGTDATDVFTQVGHSQKAKAMAAKRLIGRLKGRRSERL